MNFLRTTFMTAYRAHWYPSYWDLLALLFVLSLITLVAWNAQQMTVPYQLGQTIPISLQFSALIFYAGRTVVRMLIALFFSLLFTFVFATWAAKSERAGRVIIPIIDVLQSLPILGFLSVTIVGFIALFPGRLLGPECAAIFAIFTSQVWNMALGFYQTVRSVPVEVNEAARLFHLSAWQRFWRIDVPFSMPGLLWNTMASVSAGWFFVVASEAITVSHQKILLPGMGSYMAVAIQAADLRALGYALFIMFVVILIYDQLLFRPLVAWAEKFKAEQVSTEKVAESWVIDLFRRSRLFCFIGSQMTRLFNAFVNMKLFQTAPPALIPAKAHLSRERFFSFLWGAGLSILALGAMGFLMHYLLHYLSLAAVGHVFVLGLITALRVLVMIMLCSLIWVPVGVWIGLRPKVAQVMQPAAQFLAAFPANLLYPFIVLFIVRFQLNPNIWLTPLMILGAQWYILFNVIAGASTIPKDLLQVVDNLGVVGGLRWQRLLLPAIFPYYITGAITAAGGAWNASIVAEVASWGHQQLVATGLGAYISEYTTAGGFPQIVLGMGMMGVLVLIFNHLVWKRLYVYAESRFLLG